MNNHPRQKRTRRGKPKHKAKINEITNIKTNDSGHEWSVDGLVEECEDDKSLGMVSTDELPRLRRRRRAHRRIPELGGGMFPSSETDVTMVEDVEKNEVEDDDTMTTRDVGVGMDGLETNQTNDVTMEVDLQQDDDDAGGGMEVGMVKLIF